LIRRALNCSGIGRIREACHGLDAIRVLKAENVDAVITDHNMYPITGASLTKMIRTGKAQTDTNTPIMVVSGYDQATDIADYVDAGATHVASKNLTPASLKRQLDLFVQTNLCEQAA